MSDGLVMPSSPEAERALIGVMLLDKEAAGQIAALLSPKDFYDGKNMGVFEKLQARLAAGEPIDGVVLAAQGVLDQADFAGYVDSVTLTGAWKGQAEVLREQRQRRGLIYAGRRLCSAAFKPDCDVPAALRDGWSDLDKTARLSLVTDTSPERALSNYTAQVRSWSSINTVRSGIYELDEAIGGGVLPGQILAVVGGDGSMKTSLALAFLENYIQTVARPVLYLSLDMRPEQVALRRLLPLADMSEKRLTEAIRGDPDFFAATLAQREKIDGGRCHILDGPMELKDIERGIAQLSPGLVIWDYITATAGFKSEMECQRACVEALRRWQHKYSASWIVLSQMSELAKAGQRQGDYAGRASGGNNLSRIADTQLELYMDDVEPQPYQMAQGIVPEPQLVAIVTKCRSGVRGSMWSLEYNGPTMSFSGRAERVRREKKRRQIFTRN